MNRITDEEIADLRKLIGVNRFGNLMGSDAEWRLLDAVEQQQAEIEQLRGELVSESRWAADYLQRALSAEAERDALQQRVTDLETGIEEFIYACTTMHDTTCPANRRTSPGACSCFVDAHGGFVESELGALLTLAPSPASEASAPTPTKEDR